MESKACILCGGDGDRVVIQENGYLGRRCDRCGLVFISPRPTAAEIAGIYQRDGAHVRFEGQRRPSVGVRMDAQHALRLIRRFRSRGRLVDVGAGGGHFAQAARARGYEVSAVETNPQARARLQSLGIACADVLDTACDVIYSRDVLSHFSDPTAELDRMHGHLAPGGLLVLETGNLGDVDERYLDRFPRFQYPDHLFFFGERSVRVLLQRAGFRVVDVRRYSILPALWILRSKERVRPTGGKSIQAGGPGPAGRVRRLRGDAIDVLLHVARYGLGRILPKRGRPQTIIIVAEKVQRSLHEGG